MAGSLVASIVTLTVTALVFSQTLMPQLVNGVNASFYLYANSTGGAGTTYTTNAAAFSLWGTSQILAVVGFLFIVLAVFGIAI